MPYRVKTMKRIGIFAVCIIILSALFTGACKMEPDDGKYFEKKLRGTWNTNSVSTTYTGTLIINSGTITIIGYGEEQTQPEWVDGVWKKDDSKRPFKDFLRDIALDGYSEDGKIFIKKGEIAADGIPYTYYEAGKYPDKYKIMEFDFNGKKQIVQCPMN